MRALGPAFFWGERDGAIRQCGLTSAILWYPINQGRRRQSHDRHSPPHFEDRTNAAMSLSLRYHAQTSVPVEIEGIIPDRLRNLSPGEIERLEIFHGNRKLPLAELFAVSGEAADGRVDFEGNLAGVHYIGYGMARARSTSTAMPAAIWAAR